MTFRQAYDLALARINETVAEVELMAVDTVKNAINQAYMAVRSTVDRQLKTVSIAAASPITLPQDCIEVIRVAHSADGLIASNEYRRDGDQLHFNSRFTGGTFNVTISFFPVPLTADTDPLLVKPGYIRAIVAFGAYALQLHRRKYAAAQLLASEFSSIIEVPENAKPKN